MKRLYLRLKAKITGKPQRLSYADYGTYDLETIVLPDGSLRHVSFQKALSLPTTRPQKQTDAAEAHGSDTVITSDKCDGVPVDWSPPHDERGFPTLETRWTIETDSEHRRVHKDFDGVRITKNIELH